MTKSMKTALAAVAIVVALGGGYVASKQLSKEKVQTSNEPSTNSSQTADDSTVLDLSGKQLTSLPDSVLGRTDITVLNLSNNQLTTLPAGIGGLTSLVELNVENNRLESLPPELSQLKNLRTLDISNNRLTESQLSQLKSELTSTEIKI